MPRSAWFHAWGNIIVLALAVLNSLVHSRDAYTAVVPWGVTLSGIVALILIFAVWTGWAAATRQSVENPR